MTPGEGVIYMKYRRDPEASERQKIDRTCGMGGKTTKDGTRNDERR